MSDGHLYLSAHSGITYVSNNYFAWYDATHQSVLLLSRHSFRLQKYPLDTTMESTSSATVVFSPPDNLMTIYDFSEPGSSKIEESKVQEDVMHIKLLQLSADGQFLAIQRSDIEVQILHCATRTSYWILCTTQVGNKILHGGLIWSTRIARSRRSQDLILVTKLGLEHHRVSSERRKCALRKTVALFTHNFWYQASEGVLLVSSGSKATKVVPFLLYGANVEKLPMLVFSKSVSKPDLNLVTLYGGTYLVYIDTNSTKLLLYLVGPTMVTCVRSLNVMLPPRTALEFSVVDNLLVCHSLEFEVSVFFDIKCDENPSDPFSAPLPISMRPPGHKGDRLPLKATRWQFIAPNLVQQSILVNMCEHVEFRKLQLNLNEVYKTCERHRDIVPFLLRREDHKAAMLLVFKLVRRSIVGHQNFVSTIEELLNAAQIAVNIKRHNILQFLNVPRRILQDVQRDVITGESEKLLIMGETACKKYKPYALSAENFFFNHQSELYCDVWSDIIQDAYYVEGNCNLGGYIVEFTKSLRENNVPVDKITYLALAEYFIVAGEPSKLYQFLHYHVLEDFVELAELLVRNGQKHQDLMQMGLDMYFRLQELKPLLRTLLDLGQIRQATECAWKNKDLASCNASNISGSSFFNSLIQSVVLSNPARSSLQVWDPAALQRSSTTSLSPLASSAIFPFPDSLLLPSSRTKLRLAYGFATE
ncbi:uncharacterized protein CCR75_005468 [Bremia lactucae]|uniref:Mic1 domain-containing protein n=1 Tax=Bremia lactucae TaxID=4779 RepID=A0A976NYM7_BRELC|nr:hypothetical protein CCR75_005468 [Bremia lactucae]